MPADLFSPLGSNLFSGFQAAPQPQPTQPLTPDEEESLLSQVGSGALHGLGYVGSSMSKALGGRAIRGALGMMSGRGTSLSELASIIPFSDAMGITNAENEVHGSDLLGGDKDTSFFSPEGIGGLGIDILTDPATYLSFGAGALTKLGKAAKMANVLPKTIGGQAGRVAGLAAASPEASTLAQHLTQTTGKAVTAADIAGQRLGGHIGMHIPFTEIGTTFDMSNPIAQAASLAGQIPGAQTAANLVGRVTEPLGRVWGAGFNPEMRGLVDAKAQELAPTFTRAEKVGKETGRLQTAELMRKYGAADMVADPQGLRNVIETGANASPGATAAAADAKANLDSLFQRRTFLGDNKDQVANYFPHQAVQPDLDVAQNFLSKPSASRNKIFHGSSVDTLEKIVADPFVGTSARTAPDSAAAAAHIAQNYNVAPDVAKDLASFMYSLDPKRQKLGLFTRDSMHDYMTHVSAGESRVKMLGELYPILGKEAGAETPGSVRVGELLGDLGLSDVAKNRAHEALTQAGKITGNVPGAPLNAAKVAQDMEGLHVPREVANALGQILKPDRSRDGAFASLVKSMIDIPSNLFRGHVTQPFPGFHERNAATSLGWIQTVLTGSPKAAMEGNQMMTDLLRGGVIKGISDWPAYKSLGLTDAQVSEHVGNWMFAKGLTDQGHVADILGHSAAPSMLTGLPGMTPDRKVGLGAIGDYAKKWFPRSLEEANPFNMRGVGRAAESKFAPAAAGEGLATVIEQTGRGGGALALIKQGYNPDMAAAMTKAAHVDYSNLSGFEREVMRRLVPFYSWASNNIPFQLREIGSNPGGLTANAVKTSAAMEGRQPGFAPDYLGNGIIAGLGTGEDGKKNYLSQLGLPFEDLGNFTNVRNLLGQLNPALKFGLEQATGRQLMSGRDLSSLHPLPSTLDGVAPSWMQNAAANSPFARYFTTARAFGDERNSAGQLALNMLTGSRLSSVDPAAARRDAVQQYSEELLRRSPLVHQHQSIYVRPADRAGLSPQEMQLLSLYQLAQRNRLPQ